MTVTMPRSPLVRVTDAYSDPELLLKLAVANAPYPAPVSGYNDPPQSSRIPWFKAVWVPRSPAPAGIEGLLHSPRLVEGAKAMFDATIVRPTKILANLMGPMPALPPHVDPPMFRGVDRWSESPNPSTGRFSGKRALVGLMGTSELFEHWRVCNATAVMWYYGGDNGEYLYWPNGASEPATALPEATVALVGDNERVFHGIGDVGRPDQYLESGTITPTSELRWDDGRWVLVDGDRTILDWSVDEVRISVVWKATCFVDEADAARYDEHTDDLTVDQVTDIFRADLARRGIDVAAPADPLTDNAWFRALISTYGFPKQPGSRRRANR
ncbi:hypothetical protein AB0D32_24075 [Micromonospora sp. NPDC048170]|uniref:hypothetical protein n=1 Tax=Micromonospora sp. NPDC048170 TaxID=3154819 RepID=UPI0033E98B6E